MNAGRVNDYLRVVAGPDPQAVMKLADQPEGNNFLARLDLNSLIGDESPGGLEVVSEPRLGLKAARNLREYERGADNPGGDNQEEGSLLR